jgi:hypothetical protein
MAEPNTSSINTATARSTPTGDPAESRTGREPGPAAGREQTPPQQNRASVIDRVKQSATAQLTTQKDRGIDALGSVTQAVRSSSQRLRDEKHETIASYVDQAADQIDTWSRRIKDKDLDELVTDVQRLARRQPAVFISSAFALGLIGARFLKSSPPENDLGDDKSYRARYGAGTRRSAASAGGAHSTFGADAEVAIGAHEVAISDGSPAASRSRTSRDDSGAPSTRSRKSSSRTEKA